MKKLATLLVQTAKDWEREASATGEVRDLIGAVDETFLEYMILVLMDLHSGYILLEEIAPDRTYKTWKALVHEHELPARPETMKKVYKQLPVLAALVDFWWQGVKEDLQPMGLSPMWRQWALELLLPLVLCQI